MVNATWRAKRTPDHAGRDNNAVSAGGWATAETTVATHNGGQGDCGWRSESMHAHTHLFSSHRRSVCGICGSQQRLHNLWGHVLLYAHFIVADASRRLLFIRHNKTPASSLLSSDPTAPTSCRKQQLAVLATQAIKTRHQPHTPSKSMEVWVAAHTVRDSAKKKMNSSSQASG